MVADVIISCNSILCGRETLTLSNQRRVSIVSSGKLIATARSFLSPNNTSQDPDSELQVYD